MRIFSVNDLAAKLNIKEITPPGMPAVIQGGIKPVFYDWKYSDLPAIAETVHEFTEASDEEIMFGGGGNAWLLAAIISKISPKFSVYDLGPTGKKTMFELPMGEISPAGEVKFDVKREPGKVYVTYQCDDPNKPRTNGPHNYDIEKLPLVVLPEVKAGDDLYLTTNGTFYVLAVFVKSYVGKCASLSVFDPDSGHYVCVHAADKERLGEVK